MKVSKRKFREIALQMLYGIDISNSEPSDSLSIVKEQLKLPASTVREITAWVELVKEKAEHLDREIDRVSEIENIGPIERNILRLAVYELTFEPECPGEVAIAEAVRICQKFGTLESSKYVNAVLDTLHKEASS